jgi:FkbM family methyltransferase
MSTLVYVGANIGNSLWGIFDKFDEVYAFEPDPEIFEQLNKRFRQFEWVTLINAACSFDDAPLWTWLACVRLCVRPKPQPSTSSNPLISTEARCFS